MSTCTRTRVHSLPPLGLQGSCQRLLLGFCSGALLRHTVQLLQQVLLQAAGGTDLGLGGGRGQGSGSKAYRGCYEAADGILASVGVRGRKWRAYNLIGHAQQAQPRDNVSP